MASTTGTSRSIGTLMLLLTAAGVVSVTLDKAGKLVYSPLKVIYCLFLVALIGFGLYFQIFTYLEQRRGESLLHALLYLYPKIADSVMSVLIILSALYSTHTFLTFFHNLENQSIVTSVGEYFEISMARKQVFVSALIFVAPYFLDISFYHSSIHSKTVLYQGLSYVFVFYNFVYLNQFSLTLTAIKKMYTSVNIKVEALCDKTAINRYDGPVCVWKSSLKKSPFEMFQAEISARSQIESPDATKELHNLREEHHQIYKLCRTVNWMFALSNMGMVVHHGVLGVICSYWGLRLSIAKNSDNDVGELIDTFRSAAVSLLSIVWLVVPVTAISAEVDKTKQLIQRTMIISKDEQFHSEIKTFSLQLMLERISFSPYGFFELSNELLLSMLSAIASYLIILLQYQIMLDELDTAASA